MGLEKTLDDESLAMLQRLTEKQRNAALQMYLPRMKKTASSYFSWACLGMHNFYLGKPVKTLLLWALYLCYIFALWGYFFKYKRYLAPPADIFFTYVQLPCALGIGGTIWWLTELWRIDEYVQKANREILQECINTAVSLYPY